MSWFSFPTWDLFVPVGGFVGFGQLLGLSLRLLGLCKCTLLLIVALMTRTTRRVIRAVLRTAYEMAQGNAASPSRFLTDKAPWPSAI